MNNDTITGLEMIFKHHPPKGDQAKRYETIRKMCLDLALFIHATTPHSREKSRALTALEDVCQNAISSIARNEEKGA